MPLEDYDVTCPTRVKGWNVTAAANVRPSYQDLTDTTLFLPNGEQADWLWKSLSAKQQHAVEQELAAEQNERYWA